jgi:hypothetical protein
MRIWSLHPQYLDTKGLVAVWRESLLAKHVLEGKTKGYTQHPQLKRFKESGIGVEAINHYLSYIYDEAVHRAYKFDATKFERNGMDIKLKLTKGQLEYEFKHLLEKLNIRDQERYIKIKESAVILPHPLFEIVAGDIESWEIITHKKSDTP